MTLDLTCALTWMLDVDPDVRLKLVVVQDGIDEREQKGAH